MKWRSLWITGGVLLSGMLPFRASAISFSELYVFGDSLSDTGNIFDITNGQTPPSPPYAPGRFSNGPIWVDYLTEDLDISYEQGNNLAFGGAITGITGPTQPPGLLNQVGFFTSTLDTLELSADPDALYSIWAGANDYLNLGISDPTLPVSNLSTAVTSLATAGAENVLVFNLPDLGSIPFTNDNPVSDSLNDLTALHNSTLEAEMTTLGQTLDLNIVTLDVNSLFQEITTDPAAFGFTNVTDACLNPATGEICTTPDQYLFWDNVHPTTVGHESVASLAVQSLTAPDQPDPSDYPDSTDVPEPGVVIGLALAGLWGAARRKA